MATSKVISSTRIKAVIIALLFTVLPLAVTFAQNGGIADIDWNGDGRLAVGYGDGTVQILNESGKILSSFQLEVGIYTSVDWNPTGNKLAIAAGDSIYAVNGNTGEVLYVTTGEILAK